MNFYHILYVGIGGAIGSIARFLLIKSVDEKFPSAFPFGTLLVNIFGSLILGFLVGLTMHRPRTREDVRLFIGTGLCGGFTTFSTFAVENFLLIHEKPIFSLVYITSSLILGLAAAALGYFAGKTIA